MSPEPEPEPVRHRPLPSVDIALLPHEVRAARMQRWLLLGAALVLGLVGAGVAFVPGLWERHKAQTSAEPWPSEVNQATSVAPTPAASPAAPVAPTPPPAAPTPDPSTEPGGALAATTTEGEPEPTTEPGEAPTEPKAVKKPQGSGTEDVRDESTGRVEHKFGDAKGFKDALRKGGASPEEAVQLTAALQKLVDFRRCRPEHTLVFDRDGEQELRAFEYRAGPTEIYRVTHAASGKLRAEKVEVPIEKRRVEKGTFIAGSLGASLAAIGLGPALAGVVIEALDAKISFRKDARTGDSVKIIVDEDYVDGAFLRYGVVHAVEYTSARAGKLQAFWFEPERGGGEFYDPSGRAMHGGWLRTPLRYDHISSGYNLRRKHPILKRIMPHQGIDYSAGTGTPVWAAADGDVTFAGPRGPNGNLVSVKHGNGYESHYAHLWRIASGIRAGVHVKQRRVIGYVGTTGRSTGPHLHFALRRNGHFLDPATQLNGPGAPLPTAQMPRFHTVTSHLRAVLERIPLASAPKSSAAPAAEAAEDTADDEVVDL